MLTHFDINEMTSDDMATGNEPTDETAPGSPQSRASSDGLVQFVSTKGTQVAGRHRDKADSKGCPWRVAPEELFDLEGEGSSIAAGGWDSNW